MENGVKMGRKRVIRESALLEAINGSQGFITTIAERLNCSWCTAEKAIKASEAAQQAIRAEEEITLDMVEGKAIERIKDGDAVMIRFYLQTKGKRRGYTMNDDAMPEDAYAEDTEISVIVDGERIGGDE